MVRFNVPAGLTSAISVSSSHCCLRADTLLNQLPDVVLARVEVRGLAHSFVDLSQRVRVEADVDLGVGH